MFDYLTSEMVGPSTQPILPMEFLQEFCYECIASDIDGSTGSIETCKHTLRMRPHQLEIYERFHHCLRVPTNFGVTPTETVLSTSSAPQVGGASVHAPPSSTQTFSLPLPDSDEESYAEEEEEGDAEEAYVVEPLEAADQGESDHDDRDEVHDALQTRSERTTFLRPPPTITDGASTRASSSSVATAEEDGDYSTDSEADGAFEVDDCDDDSDISNRGVIGDIAEGVQASKGVGQMKAESEEEYEPDAEEDYIEAAPTQLGSRNRAKRTRDVWGTKRGKTLVPATAEDFTGYPAPAEVFRTIIGSGKSWIETTNATFPVDQQVLKTKRNGKEDWGCRLKLAIPRTGDVRWVYNPVPCPEALNRDGYIRHILDSHLGIERASGGSTRQDQIKKALKRCIGASAATPRSKRKAEDREDDSEPGPSRKRMREE